MSEQERAIYEFGDFRLDAVRRSLEHADGRPVPLKPKALDILLVLIERRDRIVSKEELLKLAWTDLHVEEGNLMVHMSLLRKALGDSTGQPRFIVTVSGKGYRFVGEVKEIAGDEDAAKRSTSAATGAKISYTAIFFGVIAALLLAIAGFWFWGRSAAPATPFSAIRLTKLTTSGKVTAAAVSPDGKYVAYILKDGDSQSVRLRQLSANSDVEIIPPATEVGFPGLVFSRDGEQLYFLRAEKDTAHSLYRTSKLGGVIEKIDEDVDSTPGLSPDGKMLAFIRGLPDQNETALVVLGTDSNTPRKLAARASTEGFVLSTRPSWSPDGKRIVCAVKKQDAEGRYQGLVLIDTQNGSTEDAAAPRFLQISQTAWLPDLEAKGFLVSGITEDSSQLNQIWFVSHPGGKAERITNDLNDYRELSLTADGKTIVTLNTDRQTNIWLLPEMDVERAREITSTNYDGAEGLAWTPAGNLVYSSRGSNNSDLWVIAPDGSKRQLTFGAGNNWQPDVSPDGASIAFVSDRAGRPAIWLIGADGSNARMLTGGIDDGAPNWSPDGKTIIYRSYVHGNPAIFSISSAGGTPAQLTDKISGRPRFSPDGQKILTTYRAEALAPVKLSIIPAAGGAPQSSFNFTSNLFRWGEQGQAIFFVNTLKDGGVNIWRQPIDPAAAPVPITDWNDLRIYWFDISPDGKTLACARGESLSDVVLISDNSNLK